MAKWMRVKGTIFDVQTIKEDPNALGVTLTDGKVFTIKLSRDKLITGFDIAETLLHELLHLWIAILAALRIIRPNKHETHHLILTIQHYATHVLERSYGQKNKAIKKEYKNDTRS